VVYKVHGASLGPTASRSGIDTLRGGKFEEWSEWLVVGWDELLSKMDSHNLRRGDREEIRGFAGRGPHTDSSWNGAVIQEREGEMGSVKVK